MKKRSAELYQAPLDTSDLADIVARMYIYERREVASKRHLYTMD